jgi:hydrogenase nickel incorporation protein HypA/HybF
MHEFAAATSIVETVLRSSEEQGATRVLEVELEIGQLTFLNPEQLSFWMKEGFKKTLADNAKLHFKSIRPLVHCKNCGHRGTLPVQEDPVFHYSLPVFICPSCSSTHITIEKGRECLIRKIQILTDRSDDA